MPLKAKKQCCTNPNTLMKHRIPTYNTFHIPIRLHLPSRFLIFFFCYLGMTAVCQSCSRSFERGKGGDAERRVLLETTLRASDIVAKKQSAPWKPDTKAALNCPGNLKTVTMASTAVESCKTLFLPMAGGSGRRKPDGFTMAVFPPPSHTCRLARGNAMRLYF